MIQVSPLRGTRVNLTGYTYSLCTVSYYLSKHLKPVKAITKIIINNNLNATNKEIIITGGSDEFKLKRLGIKHP